LVTRASKSVSVTSSAAASAGIIDHISEDTVGDSGRNAIGPVGRKRWYATLFDDGVRGACRIVSTITCVSYDHPKVSIPAYLRTGEFGPSTPT
jgi:hypothetical protein